MPSPTYDRTLRRSGRRRCIYVSQQAALNAAHVASESGLTQRIVLDELLEDTEALRQAAARAKGKVAPSTGL